MQSHDADRADLRIAGRSSRALSHSDVLRLASACAPSFAGWLGLKVLFFSGASWHNLILRQTDSLHARHLKYKHPVLTSPGTYLHIPAGSCFQPPSQASVQREPIDNHPSFLPPPANYHQSSDLSFLQPWFDLEAWYIVSLLGIRCSRFGPRLVVINCPVTVFT